MKQTAGAVPNRLVLELGDMVPDAGKPGAIGLDFYRFMLPYMGVDAAGIGELELRASKLVEERGITDMGVPLICANVVRESNGKPLVGKPYIVKKMPSGLKVVVTAVVGDNVVYPALQTDLGVKVLPPVEALNASVPKLRKEGNVVVVLAHVTAEAAANLATQVPGIDVIISSHPSTVQKDFQKIGSTVIMHCKTNCQYVGKITLDIDANGTITNAGGEQAPLNNKIKDDIEILKLIEATDKRNQTYYRNLSTEQTAKLNGLSTGPEPPKFVGRGKCAKCHSSIDKSWKSTKHAQAFDTLKKKDVGYLRNANCLMCHTTGYDLPGGYAGETTTPLMKSVQCESCHGAGSAHAADPKAKGYGTITEATCLQCHDKGNSPDFSYEKYLPQVRH